MLEQKKARILFLEIIIEKKSICKGTDKKNARSIKFENFYVRKENRACRILKCFV